MTKPPPSCQKEDGHGFQLETPFTIEQVQGHLILGPVARHVKLSTLALVLIPLSMMVAWTASESSLPHFALEQVFPLIYLALIVHVHKTMSRQRQAIILWGSLKITAGIACFILMTAGAMTQWFDEQSRTGALLCLTLGLTWMPGLEFIPRLTPHQKAITGGRIAITLICMAAVFSP